MKIRFFLLSLLISIYTALPALAQNQCTSEFKHSLEKIAGVEAVTSNDNGFLAILNTSTTTDIIKSVSRIKKLRSNTAASGCNFSDISVTIMDRDFDRVKSGTSEMKSDRKLSTLLYKYVHALSPVNAELNLRGYERLCELSPQNKHYTARRDYYRSRLELISDRSSFIEACSKEALKDKSIIDLRINKDFYLFVTATDSPLATAEKFLAKVEKSTPRPQKGLCIIAYNSELGLRESECPPEYYETRAAAEEELLMRHVQGLPGYMIRKNVSGYKALNKLNPGSELYAKKLAFYNGKQNGLETFISIRTADNSILVTKSSSRGNVFFATINNSAIEDRSKSENLKLFQAIASYYEQCGSPLGKCVLKNSAGTTLGTISCGKTGCNFQ